MCDRSMSLAFPEFLLCADFDVCKRLRLCKLDTVACAEDKKFEEE